MKALSFKVTFVLTLFLLSGCFSGSDKPVSSLPSIPVTVPGDVPRPVSPLLSVTAAPIYRPPEDTPFPTISPTSIRPTLILSETPSQPLSTSSPAEAFCTPLKDIPIKELATIFTNPFTPGRIGFDEGHPGIDLSYWSRGDRKTMKGHPIQTVFSGRIVSTIKNRPPYGNSVMIETPLRGLSASVKSKLALATPNLAVIPDPRLNCPGFSLPSLNPPERNSVYILYGHLDQPSPKKIGDGIQCGDEIGQVGTSGFSVNDHLHLEIRLGPSGYQFPVMAHYDNGATPNEMSGYCSWRASGIFLPLDPAQVLSLKP